MASPSKVARTLANDHGYAKVHEPEQIHKQAQVEIIKLQKKVKVLKETVCQHNKCIQNMKQLMEDLKEKRLVSNQQHELLAHNFEGVSGHLFADQASNAKYGNKHSSWYSLETKQFAVTLHYYSPKAYDFVCKVLALPHPSSIHSWAASVNCEPGFLCDIIKLLGGMVQNKSSASDVVLIVDAMSLYKGTWWDPKEWCYVGTVDYGTGLPEAEDELATEALVFMISSISGHWKHPIAYFLQNKISAEVLTQLIQDCIGLLHAEHLNVLALVFDGTFGNQSTAVQLGCKMSVSDMQTWFPHPQDDKL